MLHQKVTNLHFADNYADKSSPKTPHFQAFQARGQSFGADKIWVIPAARTIADKSGQFADNATSCLFLCPFCFFYALGEPLGNLHCLCSSCKPAAFRKLLHDR